MEFDVELDGARLEFQTEKGLFSPGAVDEGTRAMLAEAKITPGAKVLDLGCGYGVVGIWASRCAEAGEVWMIDVDERAVAAASSNVALNHVHNAHILAGNAFNVLDETGFDVILSNPPYHTDFSVAKHFIEKGFNRLKLGGRLYMVAKRRDWYENKLRSVFGGVRTISRDGYWVFEAERRTMRYALTEKKDKGKAGGNKR